MGHLSAVLRSVEGGIVFACPGCDCRHIVYLGAGPGPRWSYDGNADRPTFSPSILVRGQEARPPVTSDNLAAYQRDPWPQTKVETVCHSFVRAGRIEFLSDCTHALAGQTVDLPPVDD